MNYKLHPTYLQVWFAALIMLHFTSPNKQDGMRLMNTVLTRHSPISMYRIHEPSRFSHLHYKYMLSSFFGGKWENSASLRFVSSRSFSDNNDGIRNAIEHIYSFLMYVLSRAHTLFISRVGVTFFLFNLKKHRNFYKFWEHHGIYCEWKRKTHDASTT